MKEKRVLGFIAQLVLIVCAIVVPAYSEDGTYDATVTTDSGSYTVPVEVENGEVAFVHWPNGGDMHVYGADVVDGVAEGHNSRGEMVSIEIDDWHDENGED